MANDSNSGTVAIIAIVVLLLLGGFAAWRMGLFGGGDRETTHKIEIDSPIKTNAVAPQWG